MKEYLKEQINSNDSLFVLTQHAIEHLQKEFKVLEKLDLNALDDSQVKALSSQISILRNEMRILNEIDVLLTNEIDRLVSE